MLLWSRPGKNQIRSWKTIVVFNFALYLPCRWIFLQIQNSPHMKHIYPVQITLVVILWANMPGNIVAQCSVSVDAGPDVYLCAPYMLHTFDAEITGDFHDAKWTPVTGIEDPKNPKSPVRAGKTTTYVLSARSVNPNNNLVVNPDFEQGNTGFSSALTYSPGYIPPLNTYDILTNPQIANDTLEPCSGNGYFMATNMIYWHVAVWCQTVSVTPNTDYYWHYWATRLADQPNGGHLDFLINGALQTYSGQGLSNASPCEWRQIHGVWNSGNSTSATICLSKTKNAAAIGLDDIFFGTFCTTRDSVTIFVEDLKAVAEPSKYVIPCNGFQQTISGAGSSENPPVVIQWTTPNGNIVSGENTLNPVVDAPGKYILTVSLPNGIGPCVKEATVDVSIGNELSAWITAAPNLNCNGLTPLQGGSSASSNAQYQWVAPPEGNIVSGHNSSTAWINAPGLYTLIVTNPVTGCTATAVTFIKPTAVPTLAITPPDTLGILPDTVQLLATAMPSNAAVSWITGNGQIVSGSHTLSPLVSAPGTYMLTVTHPVSGCTTTASVVVMAAANCDLGVDAGPDILLCAPAPAVQLSGEITGDYYDFFWSPTTGMSNSKSLTPTVTTNQNRQYALTARKVLSAINLIENGDFESGNTGFTSDYQHSPGDVSPQGTYDISTAAVFPWQSPAFDCSDHSGGGNMLFVHADLVPGSQTWCQTVPVTPHTDYFASVWIMNLNTVFNLDMRVNGTTIGTFYYDIGANWQFCDWHHLTGIWNSGNNTTATLCFVRTPTYHATYAIDDISFSPMCSVTDTVAIQVTNVVATASPAVVTIPCEGFVTTLSGQGSSTGPNITYNWDTPDGHILSGQNTLNPVIDGSGTYTLTVTQEGAIGPCTKTATVVVKPGDPLLVWIQDPGPLDCNNPSQNLIAQASLAGPKTYQWAASPGGNIVAGANQAVAKVDQPGEYTVLVTVVSTGCTSTASVQIGIENQPTALITPPDTLQNLPDTIQITATATPANTTVLWTTANGQVVSGGNTLSPLISAPGTYVLTVTHPVSGCTTTSSVVVVAENACPTGVFAGLDTFLCQNGQSVQLGGVISAVWHDALWSPAQHLSDATVLDPVASVAQSTEFVLAVRLYHPNQNLLLNGAFEDGDTGFSSSLTPHPTDLSQPGRYAVLPNASAADPALPACGDHTSGAGNLLAARLPALPGAHNIWCQNVAVKPGTEYLLSAWTLHLSGTPGLELQVNNSVLNALNLPADSCLWHSLSAVWHSGASTTAQICIAADGTGALALDDLFFTPLCTVQDTVLVQVADQPVVAVATAPGILNCIAETLDLSAAGSSSGTYQWSTPDGNIAAGADTPNPNVDAPGTYLLTVTDTANGCTATAETVVDEDVAAPQIAIAPPAVLNCLTTTQTLQGQNASPPGSFTYQWSTTGGNIVSGQNTLEPEIDAAGAYMLAATNTANGCTAVAETLVNTDSATPDVALSVSDLLDCHFTPVNLTNTSSADPALLDHNWTAPDGSTINTGANPVLAVNQPGTYLLTLTNTQNGCTTTAGAIVGQDDPVLADLTGQSDASCFGAANGSLSVSASGGDGAFTYQWDSGAQMPIADNLSAGTYTVVVTDGSGCTAIAAGTVGQPDAIVPNAVGMAPGTFGGSDGTATANPAGGTAPYSYEWTGGSTEQTITGLSAGDYTVTVTDANGCTAQQTVNIFGGACDLSAQTTSSDPACHGASGGSATAIPVGGSSPFTFLWSNGQTMQTATDLEADTYSVVVTDANGCTVDADVTLNDPPLLSLTPGAVTEASCPGTPDGTATVIAGGGTGIISIAWSNGETGLTATELSAGPHTATATDENGCTSELTVMVTANDTEAPVLTGGPVTLPLGPAGVISLTLQNLDVTATDNCELAGDNIVPANFDCLQLGTHTVTVTAYDAAGNSSSLSIQVEIVDNLAPQLSCPADILHCFDEQLIQYQAPVATDNCLILNGKFDLVEGLPSGSQFPIGVTNTAYTFTDASGNVGGCTFTVTILTPITVVVNQLAHDVGGQGIGKILVSTSGSQPGYTYDWQRNGQTVATTEDLTGVGAGAYTLIVTDAEGCTTAAGPFVVDDLVSTNAPDWADMVSVYPNPTAGRVTVTLPDIALGATELLFVVFDATGRLVLEQYTAAQKQTVLDWSALTNGLYTLRVRTQQGQAVFKVVLDR